MQCLYCETELKPLRGLFDEDFCCKEHREKYFSSFRKGINLLPDLDLPPVTPVPKRVVEAPVAENVEPVPELIVTQRHVELEEEVTEEPVELPELVIPMTAAQAPEMVVEVSEPALAIAAREEPEPAAEIPEPVVEPAPLISEPPVENEPPVQIAALSAEPANLPEMPVGASVEAAFEELEAEEIAATPLAADFLYLQVAPYEAADCYFMIDENSFSACNGPSIPDVEVFCDAALDPEECLAHLIVPADVPAGAATHSATAEALAVAPPTPEFRAWNYAAPVMVSLATAELIEDVELFVPGAISSGMRRECDGRPLDLAPAPVTLPGFEAFAQVAQPAVAEPALFDVAHANIESGALMFSDMPLEFAIHSPAFQVSAVAMELDEELKRAVEEQQKEAARLAEPEMARPAAMSAAPVSHATASFQPTMPAPAKPDAPLNVPAMAAKAEAVPGMASEAMPDPPRGVASEQTSSAHSAEPVQPAIQSSVKIKNWRLKITFAKPA